MKFIINPLPRPFDAVEQNIGPTGDLEFLTGDSGGSVGPDGGQNITLVGNPDLAFVGDSGAHSFQINNLTKWTPYVVDSIAGSAPYQTIQAATDAAFAAGGGLVLIRPGTYTENLSLKAGVHYRGVSANVDEFLVMIVGTHALPDSGKMTFTRLNFTGATAIFTHSGTTTVYTGGDTNNFFLTNGGYIFDINVFNAPGAIGLDNCGDLSTASDSGSLRVNSGTGVFYSINSQLGAGTSIPMSLGCTAYLSLSDIYCPVEFTAGTGSFVEHCDHRGKVTFSGSTSGTFTNSRIYSSTAQALLLNSSGNWDVAGNVISTSNATAIGGTGAGTTYFGGNTFIGSSSIASSANISYSGVTTETGNLYSQTQSLDRGEQTLKKTTTAQTSDSTLQTIAAIALAIEPTAYQLSVKVSAFEPAAHGSLGCSIEGLVRTTGVSATLIGTPDKIINRDAAIATSDVNLIVSGNNAIIQAKGVTAKTINWRVTYEYTAIG